MIKGFVLKVFLSYRIQRVHFEKILLMFMMKKTQTAGGIDESELRVHLIKKK